MERVKTSSYCLITRNDGCTLYPDYSFYIEAEFFGLAKDEQDNKVRSWGRGLTWLDRVAGNLSPIVGRPRLIHLSAELGRPPILVFAMGRLYQKIAVWTVRCILIKKTHKRYFITRTPDQFRSDTIREALRRSNFAASVDLLKPALLPFGQEDLGIGGGRFGEMEKESSLNAARTVAARFIR
jgi:hypothetical protein